jgi:hypothetical protein
MGEDAHHVERVRHKSQRVDSISHNQLQEEETCIDSQEYQDPRGLGERHVVGTGERVRRAARGENTIGTWCETWENHRRLRREKQSI